MGNDDEIRLLLCDDQAIVAVALQQMLAECPKLTFEHVSKGADLLRAIEAFEPTVLLQDLILEDASGLDLVRIVRSREPLARLPIVVLSTTEDAKVKFEAFSSGANDYVVKFPEPYELIGRVAYHSRAYTDARLRERTQALLAHRSRLESLGTLSAGVAHEMNTPLQYLSANLDYLRACLSDIALPNDKLDCLDALRDCIEGTSRLTEIVRAMKAFTHSGNDAKSSADLPALIADVISLAKNEWNETAELSLEIQENCTPVSCVPSAIAQALLNILVNAAQAIRAQSSVLPGTIRIRLSQNDNASFIEIEDSGGGIPCSIRDRVFDPFFSTREVGKGSGQGLTTARSIVEETHGGLLSFTCRENTGTTFRIILPRSAP